MVRYSERKVGGRMQYAAFGDSKSALEIWVSDMLRRYHPMGYGTWFTKIWRDGSKDGKPAWLVTGSRRLSA